MNQKIYTGILSIQNGRTVLASNPASHCFENEKIWQGYTTHWLGKKVNARLLPQKDYETGKNIVIMWPDREQSKVPFVEIYYNERLEKYPFSMLGHLAININNE